MFFSCLLLLAVSLRLSYASVCPTNSTVGPCQCNDAGLGKNIICSGSQVDEIRDALANIAHSGFSPHQITIEDVWLPNLTSNFLPRQKVKTVIIRNCSTSSVDGDAFAAVADTLVEIHLTHNALERVPNQVLENLEFLGRLDLSGNRIEMLQADAFKGLMYVDHLSLHGNKIRFIDDFAFAGFFGLTDLDLSDNELTAVPGLPLRYQNSSLLRLNLRNNKIASLVPEDFDAMGRRFLLQLNLENNSIRHLPAGTFRSMETVDNLILSGNGIESIHPSAFRGIVHMTSLELARNRLEEIPSEALKNLRHLRSLDLSSNKICQVRKEDFFEKGYMITHLNLQNNSLVHLDAGAFSYILALKYLNLGSNRLSSLPHDMLSFFAYYQLEVLDIHDNPLHCDCRMSWYQDWMKQSKYRIDDATKDGKCATPEQHANASLASIPSEQLVCGNSTSSPPDPCCNCNTASGALGSIFTYLFPILL